jgi:predicted DNA-binding transcriptional regulator YafY
MTTQKEIKMHMREFENQTQVLACLVTAIENKNTVTFCYNVDSTANKIRTVQPHNLYHNKDKSKILLDAFQTTGDTKSNKLKQFKMFDTFFITDIAILNNKFIVDRTYNFNSDRYIDSICGVMEE